MNFGTRLKQLRKQHNLLQNDLAKKVNISYSAISKYENNKRFPDQQTLRKLADYFNVSIDYLLCRTKSESMDTKLSTNQQFDIENDKELKELFEIIKKSSKEDINQLLKYAKFLISQQDEK